MLELPADDLLSSSLMISWMSSGWTGKKTNEPSVVESAGQLRILSKVLKLLKMKRFHSLVGADFSVEEMLERCWIIRRWLVYRLCWSRCLVIRWSWIGCCYFSFLLQLSRSSRTCWVAVLSFCCFLMFSFFFVSLRSLVVKVYDQTICF